MTWRYESRMVTVRSERSFPNSVSLLFGTGGGFTTKRMARDIGDALASLRRFPVRLVSHVMRILCRNSSKRLVLGFSLYTLMVSASKDHIRRVYALVFDFHLVRLLSAICMKLDATRNGWHLISACVSLSSYYLFLMFTFRKRTHACSRSL